ncbi:hypothetical protein LIA77_08516 [Sarocladium implicatum]|nr:hypothetical protein LIA77_08516 [Sarocladium implicatum]
MKVRLKFNALTRCIVVVDGGQRQRHVSHRLQLQEHTLFDEPKTSATWYLLYSSPTTSSTKLRCLDVKTFDTAEQVVPCEDGIDGPSPIAFRGCPGYLVIRQRHLIIWTIAVWCPSRSGKKHETPCS